MYEHEYVKHDRCICCDFINFVLCLTNLSMMAPLWKKNSKFEGVGQKSCSFETVGFIKHWIKLGIQLIEFSFRLSFKLSLVVSFDIHVNGPHLQKSLYFEYSWYPDSFPTPKFLVTAIVTACFFILFVTLFFPLRIHQYNLNIAQYKQDQISGTALRV